MKNIIFDLGNVIFAIDFQRTIKKFEEIGITNAKEIYGHLAQSKIFDDLDKGLISKNKFISELKNQYPKLNDQDIIDAWNALLIGIEDGNLELLLRVKAKYRTFLLSNNNEIHYSWIMNYIKERWDLNDLSFFFEKEYYSHLVNMRKPDSEIFELVLNEQKLNPHETLFIDDSPQHIETAKKLGIKTYLMKPNESLQSALKDLL